MIKLEDDPLLIEKYIDWKHAYDYFQRKQQKFAENKDNFLPFLRALVCQYDLFFSIDDKISSNLIKQYLETDTLELNQILLIISEFENQLHLSEEILTSENIEELLETGLPGLDILLEACMVRNEITPERMLFWRKNDKMEDRFLAKDSFSPDYY